MDNQATLGQADPLSQVSGRGSKTTGNLCLVENLSEAFCEG